MENIQSLFRSADTVTETTPTSTTPSVIETPTDSFDAMMRQFLGGSDGQKVSEEELFASLVRQRIDAVKGEAISGQFASAFDNAKGTHTSPNGHIGFEDAAKSALRSLVSSGTLTTQEGDRFYSESFAAAQLDSNTSALFDNRGGANDPTIAVEELSRAIAAAQGTIEAIADGSKVAETRSLDEVTLGKSSFGVATSSSPTPSSANITGERVEEFVYKPVSDTTGNLVVLTPSSFSGQISSVVLKDADDKILATGHYSGNGNGGRDHFRFDKPGKSYPSPLTVEVKFDSGQLETYLIKNSDERYQE